jgi:hypothetical protein
MSAQITKSHTLLQQKTKELRRVEAKLRTVCLETAS